MEQRLTFKNLISHREISAVIQERSTGGEVPSGLPNIPKVLDSGGDLEKGESKSLFITPCICADVPDLQSLIVLAFLKK